MGLFFGLQERPDEALERDQPAAMEGARLPGRQRSGKTSRGHGHQCSDEETRSRLYAPDEFMPIGMRRLSTRFLVEPDLWDAPPR